MNPGAFSSSGPLSWAMYLMRKGRTGSGIFGKANYSPHPVITFVLDEIYWRWYLSDERLH
ncbi:putative runt-related transcription factor 1-like [Scophthalmus maximus]|uniref:Putative runt-related transcription factor 1-like n=1 Tax=Scophthalmus maximus TaxID=52904 RepID=A0A2U9AWF7_SCOMX|nr:putative runt-related transcription factor 1-like [Scophthalmus maximus]